MAPGRAADVSQDSTRCRADSEPAGSSHPDDVKPMGMHGREGGEGKVLSHIIENGVGKLVCTVT